jgi:transcriptional regulator with XRE-family HTH domain
MSGGLLRNRLRLWRVASGLTQDEVADLSGLSKAYISRMERGEREPRPLTKVKIARRLGVQVSDLFDVEQLDEATG